MGIDYKRNGPTIFKPTEYHNSDDDMVAGNKAMQDTIAAYDPADILGYLTVVLVKEDDSTAIAHTESGGTNSERQAMLRALVEHLETPLPELHEGNENVQQ